jgi:general secretion pathway protein F
MPTFFYKAVTNNGQPMEGKMEAATQIDVIERLQNAGHTPISAKILSAKENHKLSGVKRNYFNKNKIKQNDIVIFTRELATLLHAGLALDQALNLLGDLAENDSLKSLISDINNRIQGGNTLSSALESQGDVFNRLYLNTIRAGEASGALGVVLSRLADYLERSTELRNSVISALLYPVILFVVMLLSVFILLIFVIPQFVPLFEDMGQALPFLTQVVFGCADIVKSYWWLFFGITVITIWYADKKLQDPEVRLRCDDWCLRLPLCGELISKLEVARFSRTLGTLLSNGVPILSAILIVQEVFSNKVLANIISKTTNSLEQGHGLAKPLQESGRFPELAVQLIHVGEQTGKIEEMLLKIADIYDNESKTLINRLLTLFEPIMILSMGAVISIIIVSILSAMLGLNDLIV